MSAVVDTSPGARVSDHGQVPQCPDNSVWKEWQRAVYWYKSLDSHLHISLRVLAVSFRGRKEHCNSKEPSQGHYHLCRCDVRDSLRLGWAFRTQKANLAKPHSREFGRHSSLTFGCSTQGHHVQRMQIGCLHSLSFKTNDIEKPHPQRHIA